jgi:DNA-directed RNA polymerase specialized sigma24 family protein
MKWNEVIQKRREREAMKENPFDLKIAANLYQLAIAEAIQRLSRMERQAVGLYYLEGLPVAKVADRLGMSWDGADELIERGVASVRKYLKGSRFEYKTPRQTPSDLEPDALADLADVYMGAAL